MDQVFGLEQTQARHMQIQIKHPQTPNPINLVGSPLKLSDTEVEYRLPPPMEGENTIEVLKEILGMPDSTIQSLVKAKVIK
jgi:crotonobetainyl-CoA:carnitine CoA-transferase CaiB-like acyl-CoA transferase